MFPFQQRENDIEDVFPRVSHELRLPRTSSVWKDANDFSDCDLAVELQRVADSNIGLDNEALSSGEYRLPKLLADSAIGMVYPHLIRYGRAQSILWARSGVRAQ